MKNTIEEKSGKMLKELRKKIKLEKERGKEYINKIATVKGS